jgi:hypothetical protein
MSVLGSVINSINQINVREEQNEKRSIEPPSKGKHCPRAYTDSDTLDPSQHSIPHLHQKRGNTEIKSIAVEPIPASWMAKADKDWRVRIGLSVIRSMSFAFGWPDRR